MHTHATKELCKEHYKSCTYFQQQIQIWELKFYLLSNLLCPTIYWEKRFNLWEATLMTQVEGSALL